MRLIFYCNNKRISRDTAQSLFKPARKGDTFNEWIGKSTKLLDLGFNACCHTSKDGLELKRTV